ncbi:MAG: DUF2779 domain-containing protein [Bacillota bacterium]|nr:DUF2779 domain-containing protein [Bacillota bacterium]
MVAMHFFTKSKYITAVKCPKALWLSEHKPEAAEDTFNEHPLAEGVEVGELARRYFGEYEFVEYRSNLMEMVKETERLLASGAAVIAEASFIYNGLFCSVDLLRKTSLGYEIIEVKSGTKIKDIYKDDIAFQYYVLSSSGLNITGAYLMHLNKNYIRNGGLDLQELFILTDYTEGIVSEQKYIVKKIQYARNIAEQNNEIEVSLSDCPNIKECVFSAYCKKELPSPSIFDIAGMRNDKKQKYFADGVESFEDVLYKAKLNEAQTKQVKAELNDVEYIEKESIKAFLDKVKYPVYYIDFESVKYAVPRFDGINPYKEIPFQFSIHVQDCENGDLKHYSFLADAGRDPRREFAEKLCEIIPKNVNCIVYHKSAEIRMLMPLAEMFPDLREHLLNICENIVDIEEPFRKKDYYCKAMKGLSSVKVVLPALFPNCPELDYNNLEGANNGLAASHAFWGMDKMSEDEKEKTRKELLEYCKLDTFAMVKIHEKLKIILD